eukprot:762781-Hanusia_phi.AAC.12
MAPARAERAARWWMMGLMVAMLLVGNASSKSFEADDDDADEWSSKSDQHTAVIDLEHMLSEQDGFVPRSKLTYTGPKSGSLRTKRHVSVHVQQATLSSEDMVKFQKLIDSHGFYKLRVQSDVNDPKSEKVMASLPACLLAASNFHEMLRFHVDQHGHIRSIWYQTMVTDCPPSIKLNGGKSPIVTSLTVDMESKGPKLSIEPVAKIEKEAQEKQQEQQSFFKKYWYYILGGLLIMSLLSGPEDDRGRGGARAAR